MICIANSCLWKKEAAVETYLVYKVVILGEWNFIFWVQTIKINLNIKYCHWTRKLSPNEVCNPLAVFSLPVYAAFLEWIGLNAIYTLLYLCMKTVMCWKSIFFFMLRIRYTCLHIFWLPPWLIDARHRRSWCCHFTDEYVFSHTEVIPASADNDLQLHPALWDLWETIKLAYVRGL